MRGAAWGIGMAYYAGVVVSSGLYVDRNRLQLCFLVHFWASGVVVKITSTSWDVMSISMSYVMWEQVAHWESGLSMNLVSGHRLLFASTSDPLRH